MKQELVKLICPQCGKEFHRTPGYLRQYSTYKPCCSPKCRNANIKAVRAEGRIQCGERMRAENGELRLPHSRVNIRITKPVEIYPAERYSPPTSTKRYGYVIQSGGKRINIRADECVEV